MIERLLDDLKKLDKEVKAFRDEMKIRIDDLLTPEIKEKLARIDEYYKGVIDNSQALCNLLESEIKAEVLKQGPSVKSDNGYQAVYSKGRITWDTKALNGYALAHPEIEKLRNPGKPSVSIRKK